MRKDRYKWMAPLALQKMKEVAPPNAVYKVAGAMCLRLEIAEEEENERDAEEAEEEEEEDEGKLARPQGGRKRNHSGKEEERNRPGKKRRGNAHKAISLAGSLPEQVYVDGPSFILVGSYIYNANFQHVVFT